MNAKMLGTLFLCLMLVIAFPVFQSEEQQEWQEKEVLNYYEKGGVCCVLPEGNAGTLRDGNLFTTPNYKPLLSDGLDTYKVEMTANSFAVKLNVFEEIPRFDFYTNIRYFSNVNKSMCCTTDIDFQIFMNENNECITASGGCGIRYNTDILQYLHYHLGPFANTVDNRPTRDVVKDESIMGIRRSWYYNLTLPLGVYYFFGASQILSADMDDYRVEWTLMFNYTEGKDVEFTVYELPEPNGFEYTQTDGNYIKWNRNLESILILGRKHFTTENPAIFVTGLSPDLEERMTYGFIDFRISTPDGNWLYTAFRTKNGKTKEEGEMPWYQLVNPGEIDIHANYYVKGISDEMNSFNTHPLTFLIFEVDFR